MDDRINGCRLTVAERQIMTNKITIVDRWRGPQLSSSRITVQDLVPYFQRKCSDDEILEIMPVLSIEEIRVVERYVQENFEAVMEQDRRIRERNVNRINPPEIEEIAQRGKGKLESLREQFTFREIQ
jgi:uncharacterized protein (DUF433 family)